MGRTPPHSWLRAIYLPAVIVGGGVVIGASLVLLAASPPPVDWYVLAGLVLLNGSFVLRFPQFPASFSTSDAFTIMAALLFGPAAGAVLVAVDGLIITSRLARRQAALRRVLFNATGPAIAMRVSAEVFFRVADTGPLAAAPNVITQVLGPLALFAGVYFILNTGLTAIAIALDAGESPLVIWQRHFRELWLSFAGGAWLAAVVIMLVYDRQGGPAAIGLLVPLPFLMYFAFKKAVGRMQQQVDDLERVNRLYHSLIHGAAYGIGRVKVDGRFVDVNPALARMLGYDSEAELQAQNFWVHVSTTSRADGEAGLSADGRPQTSEQQWQRRDGSRLIVRLSSRLTRGGGDDIPTLEMMVEDVTERRALEARVREAEKLDALGRMARGIVHDFNNLLTVIGGMAELIRSDLGPDQFVIELRELQSATATARELTGQLLAFTRQQPIEPTVLSLNAVITDTVPVLKRLAGAAVTINCELAPSIREVRFDRTQLQQVIMNLVVNARDAMPSGGRLTIATAPSASGPGVCLAISDTGTGMPADVRAHIFEPYFTTKAPGQGTGLGLATVYGIVRQHGGDIKVSSMVGAGTTFLIELPPATDHGDRPDDPSGGSIVAIDPGNPLR